MDRHRGPLTRTVDRHRAWPSARTVLLVAVVPGAFLAVFFAWPVATILWRGFAPDGTLDIATTLDILGERRWWNVAWFTTWQAVASTIVTLAVGLPVAGVFARYDFPGRRWLRAGLTVPFVLPTVVVGTAFVVLLGANGPLGVDLGDTVTAIVIAHVFFNVAIVVRTVGDAWGRLNPRTERAARTLGAGPIRTWVEITAPRLMPAMLAAASIVFLFSFTSFGVVLLLGGPGRTTLEVETYIQTTAFLNLDVAAVLAMTQMVIVVSLLAVQRRVRSRLEQSEQQRREGSNRRKPQNPRELIVLTSVVGAMAVFITVPLGVLVNQSFRTGSGYGLAHYRNLGNETSAMFVTPLEAIWNSVRFGLTAMLIAVVVGTLASAAIAYGRGRASHIFDLTLMLPLGTSAATLGFGILITLDKPPVDLRTSAWLIPVTHALVGVPFVIRLLVPTIRAVEERLREAATILGASPFQTWREIDVPLIARAVVASAGFAFAVSLGEFGATAFIARPEHPTLPTAIVRYLSRPGAANFGQAMAMSTILMVVTVGAVLVIERFRIGETGDF